MKKSAKLFAVTALTVGLGLSAGQANAALCTVDGKKVDETTWVGMKIYERAFGRGCGTCHDVSPNPNLLEAVGRLSKDEFAGVLKNGKNAMPKAVDAIMAVGPAKKAGFDEAKSIDAIYNYLKCRSDGTVPAGKLKKIK